jgi:hypothetical protein
VDTIGLHPPLYQLKIFVVVVVVVEQPLSSEYQMKIYTGTKPE